MRSLGRRRHRFRNALAGISVTVILVACSGSTHRTAPVVTTPSTPATAASTSSAPTTSTAPACTTAAALASWSVARLAAQTIVVPVPEANVGAVASDVRGGAGGILLFGSSAPPDLAAQLAAVRAAAPGGIAPLVMTDEEGGDVQRMANLVGAVPSARAMGSTMSAAQIRDTARALALRMGAAGVTMDLAPVLDADGGAGPNDRDPDGTRSFGADATRASVDARAFAAGLAAGGVTAVAKHFPGLGGASGNTDVAPATTLPWSVLQRVGLVPFADAVTAGVPAIMVANAVVPGLTTLPAAISPRAINGVLRDRLGYRGLVLTDSLSAAALRDIGYSVPRAATAALAAGADMFLYDSPNASAVAVTTVDALVAAVRDGRIGRARLESAVSHVLAVKRIDLCTRG